MTKSCDRLQREARRLRKEHAELLQVLDQIKEQILNEIKMVSENARKTQIKGHSQTANELAAATRRLRDLDDHRNSMNASVRFIHKFLQEFVQNLNSFEALGEESDEIQVTERRAVNGGFWGRDKVIEVETEKMKIFKKTVGRDATRFIYICKEFLRIRDNDGFLSNIERMRNRGNIDYEEFVARE